MKQIVIVLMLAISLVTVGIGQSTNQIYEHGLFGVADQYSTDMNVSAFWPRWKPNRTKQH